MAQKLSDTLVRQIDAHDPFMQNMKIAKRYNELVDDYNKLEAEYNALKNPTDDQQTDNQNNNEIPVDNDEILNDTETDNTKSKKGSK